jgi:hypothetical protein
MWELWTAREPYEGQSYVSLMLQMADPAACVRPPVPGTPEWEEAGPPPPEPAPGWAALMRACWAEDPAARPDFPSIVEALRAMLSAVKPPRAVRSGRAASGAAAPASPPPAAAAAAPASPPPAAAAPAAAPAAAANGAASGAPSVPGGASAFAAAAAQAGGMASGKA